MFLGRALDADSRRKVDSSSLDSASAVIRLYAAANWRAKA